MRTRVIRYLLFTLAEWVAIGVGEKLGEKLAEAAWRRMNAKKRVRRAPTSPQKPRKHKKRRAK